MAVLQLICTEVKDVASAVRAVEHKQLFEVTLTVPTGDKLHVAYLGGRVAAEQGVTETHLLPSALRVDALAHVRGVGTGLSIVRPETCGWHDLVKKEHLAALVSNE